MVSGYAYAGPDGSGIAALPAGTGAAIGSEYCTHLLPAEGDLREAAAAAGRRRVPLVLLTPYLREAELRPFAKLLRAIPDGADVTVAVNDWGALLAARTLFPRLRISVGRLLSGQKRCPRIGGSGRLTPEGRAWHGAGLFSSTPVRRYLRERYRVDAYHIDRLDWGPLPADAARGGEGEPPATLFVHAPYAVVTVSDSCPWIGGRSSAAVARCPRPCRDATVVLREPSMPRELIQRGKARFARFDAAEGAEPPSGVPALPVLYDDVP